MLKSQTSGQAGRPDFANALPLIVAQAEMRSRERLVWAERAVRGSGVAAAVGPMLVGLGVTAFAVFWVVSAWSITRAAGDDVEIIGWIFPLFGIPFVLVGLGLVTAPLRRIGMPRPIYALSSQRILIIEGRRGENVRSFDILALGHMSRRERPDGSGDISFSAVPGAPPSLSRLQNGLIIAGAQLIGLPNVRQAGDDIERFRRRAEDELRRQNERVALAQGESSA